MGKKQLCNIIFFATFLSFTWSKCGEVTRYDRPKWWLQRQESKLKHNVELPTFTFCKFLKHHSAYYPENVVINCWTSRSTFSRHVYKPAPIKLHMGNSSITPVSFFFTSFHVSSSTVSTLASVASSYFA